jgi:hypothetical protein
MCPAEAHALVTRNVDDQAARSEGGQLLFGDEDKGCAGILQYAVDVRGAEVRAVAMFKEDPRPNPTIDPAEMRRVNRNRRSFALREEAGMPSESCCFSTSLVMD